MNKYLAEFIGAFALVLAGTGAIANNATLVGVAFAHGLAIMVMAFAFGKISGGHFNPAVTVTMAIGGKMDKKDFVPYLVAQCAGAIAASALITDWYGKTSGLTLPTGITPAQTFAVEVILSFLLVTVILRATDPDKGAGNLAPLAIGMTITLDIMAGGPITGASMNPARSLGPAVLEGNFNHFWIYVAAPIAGGLLALAVSKVGSGQVGETSD
ncbi:MAG: MIP/aquaporin family protein [Opitutales bacterium]